ncbi:MAG: hypothetical protein CMJ84_13200 [Planctomycetes bacterium]|nr:hypothetical protein [Planctomycetota bacterium]MDP6409486.1 hypothetical protein [Planctomycetota bacterium]
MNADEEERADGGGGEREADPDGWHAEGWDHLHLRSLSLGLVAMVPLLLAYELAAGGQRNTAEVVLFHPGTLAGLPSDVVRRAVMVVALAAAGALCFTRRIALGPGVLRIVLEGLGAAIVLGPTLVGAMKWLGAEGVLAPRGLQPSEIPALAGAALAFGGAAYEELLLRVGGFGLLFMVARRVGLFWGLPPRAARWAGEGAGVVGTAVAFAAFHLATFTAWLGPGGEAFDERVFTWRLLAGILLAVLFRWRGPGVAAWSHGLFNLALLIGAGPEVLP